MILSVFIILIILEFKTPPAYVFGYLYTGAILLVNVFYGGKATFIATIVSVFLTLLNLYVHIGTVIELPTLANRLIATLSLIVTGWLSNSNRIYQQKNS